MVWHIFGYTVARAWAGPRNSTRFTRLFSPREQVGSGDETNGLLQHCVLKESNRYVTHTITTHTGLNLEDTDDTLTPDLTTPRYQPTIDLKRFQRLLEQAEPPQPSTGPSVNPHPLSSLDGGRSTTLEQGVQTVDQRGWERRERASPSRVDETELSSISQDAAMAGTSAANHTVDSEFSSLYTTQPQPKQAAHTDRSKSGGARTDPQSATRLPPPSMHPLQVVQKMPHPVQTTLSTHEGEKEEGRGSEARVRKTSPRKTTGEYHYYSHTVVH